MSKTGAPRVRFFTTKKKLKYPRTLNFQHLKKSVFLEI